MQAFSVGRILQMLKENVDELDDMMETRRPGAMILRQLGYVEGMEALVEKLEIDIPGNLDQHLMRTRRKAISGLKIKR